MKFLAVSSGREARRELSYDPKMYTWTVLERKLILREPE